jgi:hypothetical protein
VGQRRGLHSDRGPKRVADLSSTLVQSGGDGVGVAVASDRWPTTIFLDERRLANGPNT